MKKIFSRSIYSKGRCNMNTFQCPCCGYLTLDEQGRHDICWLCNWQDDGQNDLDADRVKGGPNADYSLTEARHNFKHNYTMYRETNSDSIQNQKKLRIKKDAIHEFEKLQTSNNKLDSQIWENINRLEQELNFISYKHGMYDNHILENHKELLTLIYSDDPDAIVRGLVSLALYADDPEFIQDTMIQYSQHPHDNVKGIAILCFGHLARRFGKLDKELVLPIVQAGLQDKSEIVRGHADSALDDIKMFAL